MISAQEVLKTEVSDISWNDNEYHAGFNTPKSLLREAEKNDVKLEDGSNVQKYVAAVSPDVSMGYS